MIVALGKPVWVAGGCATPEKLKEALALGARGIQVGTAFAYSRDSGVLPEFKAAVWAQYKRGELVVKTDFEASPTGYPFKTVRVHGVSASEEQLAARTRICDLGYLREVYRTAEGKLGYRCGSEPIKAFIDKGGTEAGTVNKQCLCNGLLATIGMGQSRKGELEFPLITAGDDFSFAKHLPENYGAVDVVNYLLGKTPSVAASPK